MGVLDGGVDCQRGRASFGSKCGASHRKQWGLSCIVVRERLAVPKLLWEELLYNISIPVVPDIPFLTEVI